MIHVLYLDGGTDQDSGSGSVLGLAYTGTSFALFKQSCDATANLVVSPDEVEATVLVHEVGHLLGLVNLLLVRGAVEAHGGSVAVRSSVEEGTTFTARLPLDAGA